MTPHHTRNRVLAAVAFVIMLAACLQSETTVFLALLAVATVILAYLCASDVFRYRSLRKDSGPRP